MQKKLEEITEYCVKFTEDEMAELNISPGDKFSVHLNDDKSIILKKYETIEIDLSEFTRDLLEFIIKESCDKDVSVNSVIEEIIKKEIKNFE